MLENGFIIRDNDDDDYYCYYYYYYHDDDDNDDETKKKRRRRRRSLITRGLRDSGKSRADPQFAIFFLRNPRVESAGFPAARRRFSSPARTAVCGER